MATLQELGHEIRASKKSKGTRKQYANRETHLLRWLKEKHAELLDDDENVILPLRDAILKNFMTHISQ